MTIKFEYKCNACSHDYIEQRGQDEPNPYFSTCHSCKIGIYEETFKTVLTPEPERSVVVEEQSI